LVIPHQTLVYAYIVQLAMASIPIIYSRLTHRDLRNYGLKVAKKLLVQGVSLSIGIGICLSLISSPGTLTVGWFFLSCLLAPICEEFFFRGFLQTHLMEKVRAVKRLSKFHLSYGLMLATLIFGAVHFLDIFLLDLSFVDVIINAIFAMIFGLLMGYIYQETDSILTPILMHICLNGLSLLPL
jgi:membrane protease YdiL (CAAX protease family)